MDQLKLAGATYTVRKWPFRPGWRFCQRITGQVAGVLELLLAGDLGAGLVDLSKIDFKQLAATLSDENFDLVVEMIAASLEWKNPDQAKAIIETFDFEEGITTLEHVLRKNLTFLLARFEVLRTSNEISTPPPQSSAAPASQS